ncbi:MAG TPA: hypothetical protein DE315_04350, partial [Candidatus Omnitrophica bacterium]|nr:hypothetical protein [Candidatus Omnitrophota bacterium]HCI44746.1 hypothetical protein [Candidatus Omnitrophota bacterium]
KLTKSHWAKSLKILIKYNQKETPDFDIITKGKAKKVANDKKLLIISFLKERFYFQYIPAIRGVSFINDIIRDLIEAELESVESNADYIKALKQIEDTQKPTLDKLGAQLSRSIQGFIPTVKSLDFIVKEDRARYLRRSFNVLVDDGVKTELQRKGDGIKSLVAISLVKYLSEQAKVKKSIILALEEPESHLHPNAVHQLKAVLDNVSNNMQIIVTTHSPIFVDRMDPANNILVSDNKARPAKNINRVREILGVQVSDNLASASFIILAEGGEDQLILQHWIKILSPNLSKKIVNGSVMIYPMVGVTNLSYHSSHYKEQAFQVHAFIDNDSIAQGAYAKAVEKSILSHQEVHMASVPRMKESEIEDLIDPKIYINAIQKECDVDLNNTKFRSDKKKWTERVQYCFLQQGKPWNDKIKLDVKKIVVRCLVDSGELGVLQERVQLVKGFIDVLVDKTKNL